MRKIQVEVTASMERHMQAICEQEGCSEYVYILSLIKHDISSRREAGWNARDGWAGREQLEALRAASFQKTLARA